MAPDLDVPTTLWYSNRSGAAPPEAALATPQHLIFKATHLSGAVLLLRRDQITCLRGPCLLRRRESFEGTRTAANASLVAEALRASCKLWLSVRYKARLESRLYHDVTRGCMLEEAMTQEAHDVAEIKVFAFHGKPVFAMVNKNRFKESASVASSSKVENVIFSHMRSDTWRN